MAQVLSLTEDAKVRIKEILSETKSQLKKHIKKVKKNNLWFINYIYSLIVLLLFYLK